MALLEEEKEGTSWGDGAKLCSETRKLQTNTIRVNNGKKEALFAADLRGRESHEKRKGVAAG